MLKPLGDKVVIKSMKVEEKTKGGIVLPNASKEKSDIAEVIAVGPGTHEVKISLKVGDKVVCSKYAGTIIVYEGEEYTIIKENDVLAIVD